MNTSVLTRYFGPTNTRGSRIIATLYGARLTVPWDYELDTASNHHEAAKAIARKQGMTYATVQSAYGPRSGHHVHILVGC